MASTTALMILGIIAIVLLAGILLYVAMAAGRHRKAPPALLQDQSVHRADDALSHAEALSADTRPSA